MYLYLQAIQKDRDVSNHQIQEIKRGDWKSVINEGAVNNSQQVLKYLNQISKLKVIQKQQSEDNQKDIFTKGYAKEHRKGLRVIPYNMIR